VKIPKQRALILMGFGIGAGLLSGMFGLGGGIIIVPGLMFALRMDQRRAHGTSLAGVLPISMASIITYWVHDHIDWTVTLWLTIGSVGGALIGARLLAVLPKRVLTLLFVAVLAIAGIRMFFEIDTTGTTVIDTGSAIALIVIGFFVGALAGMLGIGGGLITVPIMIVIFHVPPAVAKGTALAVVIPTALSGTVQNMANKNADLFAALLVSATGIFAAVVGGWIASLMSAAVSNFLFAVLLMVIAGRMLLQLREQREVTPIGE
jgi:uncharacterized membrane protein YfcA